ncbi:7TM GPCR protein [Aphelenchoides avenae]|nr:7TM GPCR protein [Aphelenchus avenae]
MNSTSLVIGNGYFGNLRPTRHRTERVCFAISIFSNSILAVLLIREKNEVMKPYSRVLLINVAFDYFYTIVSMIVEIELEMNDGVYIFVVNGIPKHFSEEVQKAAVGIFLYSCASVYLVSPIEFIFRYFLVVRGHILKYWQLLLLASCTVLLSIKIGMFLYLAVQSVDDHEAAFGHLMTDPMWYDDGRKVIFFGADKNNVYLLLFVGFAFVEDMAIFATMLFSTLTTLAVLRQNRHRMSMQTRYMQSQINRLMFAEVFSLASVAIIPMALILSFLFLKVQWIGFGVFITLMLQWIPAVNPITTIFLVGQYRRKLFSSTCLSRKIADVLNNHSTASTSHLQS